MGYSMYGECLRNVPFFPQSGRVLPVGLARFVPRDRFSLVAQNSNWLQGNTLFLLWKLLTSPGDNYALRAHLLLEPKNVHILAPELTIF